MPDPTMADVFRAISRIRKETPDMAWMLEVPGVNKLLIKFAANQIDEGEFWSEVYKTSFWRNTSDAQRQWRSKVNIDPGKARRERQEMAVTVRQLMGEMGIRVPGNVSPRSGPKGPAGYDTRGGNAAARIADLALYNGWSEDRLTNYLLSFATWGQEGQSPTGGIGVAMTKARQLAEEYGINPRDRRLFQWSRQILAGTETIEGLEEKLRARAQAKYGANEDLAGVLDRGGTVADWFDPYRRMIAEELEIPDAEISMNDRRWQRVLMHDDGTRVRPMTFDEAQKFVRSRPEWATTRGAQEKEAELTNNLLAAFGARA